MKGAMPTATAFGVSATISYRLKYTEDWIPISGTTFNPSVAGEYEVRYTFGNYLYKTYKIKVKEN